jgi:RsiW-degrading membrane proteinase PrsW (M82 family)
MHELHVFFDGQSYSFQTGQTVRIGRSPDNDIVIGDPTVSRQHARLTFGPEGWAFELLGQARAFQHGQDVTRVLVGQPAEITLASLQGPVLRVQAASPASQQEHTAPPQTGGTQPAGEQTARPGDPHATWLGGPPPSQPGGGFGPPGGGVPPGTPHAAAPSRDELVTAFEILVPIRSWLRDPGWRQGFRLLVIPYALLPLIFIALFSSSNNLTTPGFAYSLYIAPLWAIAFWLLLRPGRIGRIEAYIAVGIVVWVTIWQNVITININNGLVSGVQHGNLFDALAAGYNEEITKALPVLLAALLLLKYRSMKLGVRMWMLLGTVSGLTFGVLEARSYTERAILQVATAHVGSQADAGVLDFIFRVFVDGFQHAIWAGVSAFFIGIAVNYPRRRWQLVIFGISIAAVLHGLNDWSLDFFHSYWPWIIIQAFSLLLFLGYTMSATSIERQVRRTPLFRGESILMDMSSEANETGTA